MQYCHHNTRLGHKLMSEIVHDIDMDNIGKGYRIKYLHAYFLDTGQMDLNLITLYIYRNLLRLGHN